MNVVDSSCWLEYFSGSNTGDFISSVIEDVQNLIVPSITIYEVFKKLLVELDEDKALFAVAHMKQGRMIDLDFDLSVFAAKIGKEKKLALADSIIYATAVRLGAVLWTQDHHFENMDFVKYIKKE